MDAPATADKPAVEPAEPHYSVETIAKLLMLTSRRVQYLAKEGVIPRPTAGLGYPLVGCIQGYIHFLQTKERQGAKRLDEDARLRAAQADLRELEFKKARGEMVSATTMGQAVLELQAAYVSDLDALPSRMAPDLLGIVELRVMREKLEHETKRIRHGIFERLGALVARVETRVRRGKAARKTRARRVG